MTEAFEFLQAWYRAQCNGYWEHQYGVTIETLDNPGWMLTVDLAETPLEQRPMQAMRTQRSDKDWMVCEVEHKRFVGTGDPGKLGALLDAFRRWAA